MKRLTALAAIFLAAACSQDAPGTNDGSSGSTSSGAGSEQVDSMSPEERGKRLFSQETCATCHTVREGDVNRIGPNLFGVVGREAGQVEGFAYTNAMSQSGVTWDEESLDAFLENPQGFMRGNRMAYVGQRDAEKRAALIAYLKTLKPSGD